MKAITNKKITGDSKIELELAIKEEIVKVQKQREECVNIIKGLEDNTHLFPLYNCRLHFLESYKESLENIKY